MGRSRPTRTSVLGEGDGVSWCVFSHPLNDERRSTCGSADFIRTTKKKTHSCNKHQGMLNFKLYVPVTLRHFKATSHLLCLFVLLLFNEPFLILYCVSRSLFSCYYIETLCSAAICAFYCFLLTFLVFFTLF